MADENDAKNADDQESEVTPEQATPEENADEKSVETGDEAEGAKSEPNSEGQPDAATPDEGPAESEDENKVVNEGDASEDDAESAMLAMLEDLPDEQTTTKPEDIDFDPATAVSNAEFQQLSEPAGKSEPRNIDLLMDVNLPVAIELGRTKMCISDILALGPGSVVELNKLAGEPVDLLVNQKIVARGEVVVIDENFGVRITQLLTAEERLAALGED